MDQQNKPEVDIVNVPASEEASAQPAQANEKDEEFARAVAKANEVLGDDDEEAPAEHVPTEFEKKMAAIPENKWNLYQIICGILIGAFTAYSLFAGEDSSFLFITALCLALIAPNQFEKSANRKVYKGRVAMCITLAIGLVIMFVYFMATGRLTNPTA